MSKKSKKAKTSPAQQALLQRCQQVAQWLQSGRLAEAGAELNKILKIAPRLPQALTQQGILCAQRGQLAAAFALFDKVARLDPNFAEVHYQRAGLLFAQGQLPQAIAAYQQTLASDPGYALAAHNLGVLYKKMGQPEHSLQAYLKARAIDPNIPQTHYNIGIHYLERGASAKAIEAFEDAVRLDPEYRDARYNLGNQYCRAGRFAEAESQYRHCLAQDSTSVQARMNLAIALQGQNQFAAAEQELQQALAAAGETPELQRNLANLYLAMGEDDKALASFRRLAELEPGSAVAEHFIAALSGEDSATAPRQYVQDLFDECADNFEQILIGKLAYSVPERLRTLFDQHCADLSIEQCADLGCGSGLAGQAFRSRVKHLSGLDLSPRMIAQAESKQIYDQLYCGDICEWLESSDQRYDLFIAADVFVYLGALEQVFAAVRGKAKESAYLLFSVETTATTPYCLTKAGRFAHSPAYIGGLAEEHGFVIRHRETRAIRKEGQGEIAGELYLLQLA